MLLACEGVLVALLSGLLLTAPPSISVAPIQGKGSKACTSAIRELAGQHGALAPWRAKGREPPGRWAELERWLTAQGNVLEVDIVVLGTVSATRLVLEAYDPGRSKLIGLRRVNTAKRCKLGAQSRQVLGAWFEELVALSSGSAPPESGIGLVGEDREERRLLAEEHARGADLLGGRPTLPEPRAAATSVIRADPAQPVSTSAVSARFELGFAVVRRTFEVQGAATANLRNIELDGMPGPSFAIELSPLAGGPAALAPLFLSFRHHRTLGVTARRPEGGPDPEVTYTDASALAGYRLTWAALEVSPFAGLRRTSSSLSGAGSALEPDLPDVAYLSLELGAALDVPLGSELRLFGSAAYLFVGSGGEVFSRAFFPEGSGYGLELQLGGRHHLGAGIWVLLGAGLLHYDLTLSGGAGRVAESGADLSLSLRSGLVLEL